jgi:hypothetical protein
MNIEPFTNSFNIEKHRDTSHILDISFNSGDTILNSEREKGTVVNNDISG